MAGKQTAAARWGAEAALLPPVRAGGPMPWVIAIMIALTVIAAASGLSLRNAAHAASADLSGGLTVQIVHAAPAERDRQGLAAQRVLKQTPGVASVRLVPQGELDTLLEPWLGTRPGDGVEGLPIPALIDVALSGPATPARVESLRVALAAVAPAARVDAQAAWLAPVFGAIGALQWLAGGLIALLAVATAAAVLLAARNTLGTQRETIEIVHMLGGTDAQIARGVQRGVAVQAASGGVVGLALGIIGVFLLGRSFSALGSGLVASGGLHLTDWLMIALIPLAGVALAVLTARLTVLAALRRFL
ncbi:cell division protein [Novosphingobium sp.]|uniref:cell division protein FtsX n=1 Tax=Novosphingobium sp. TaxID=1874826 RepID=UPI0025F096DC|nr:cell division protein [Novosphingobium sp.]